MPPIEAWLVICGVKEAGGDTIRVAVSQHVHVRPTLSHGLSPSSSIPLTTSYQWFQIGLTAAACGQSRCNSRALIAVFLPLS